MKTASKVRKGDVIDSPNGKFKEVLNVDVPDFGAVKITFLDGSKIVIDKNIKVLTKRNETKN